MPPVPPPPCGAVETAEAARLLTQLRADIDRIRHKHDAGKFSHAAVLVLVADIAKQEQHAARGWDVLELLRDLVRMNPRILTRRVTVECMCPGCRRERGP